ncbi:MAG: sugar phosphate isomerase/epimerase [Gemmatimonadetes bacterium]|mgnify:CR=1 FL=1|jgi:sugar phosphate isomerase/epimerase|nr:sugar phosphate isomerase/epimerase [Gemmatimonadota bacterium]
MLKIGIRSASWTDSAGQFTRAELEFLKNTGFDLVELNFNRARSGLDYADTRAACSWRRWAEELEICLVAHAPDHLPLSWPEKERTEESVGEYKTYVEGIAAYGIETMVVHARSGSKPEYNDDQDAAQLENFCRALGDLVPLCERHRIRILLETLVPGRFASRMDRLIRLVDAVDSPWIGICLDTNHLNLSEDIFAAMERAGHRLGEFHLNDNHGEREEHLLPGSGLIDWKRFAAEVAALGYDESMIMEPSWHPDEDPNIMICSAYAVAQDLQKEIAAAGRKESVIDSLSGDGA